MFRRSNSAQPNAQGTATVQVGAMSKRRLPQISASISRRVRRGAIIQDRYDALDPQISERNFVEFRDDLRDHSGYDLPDHSGYDDEVKAREIDPELRRALQANKRNALTEVERVVLELRIEVGAPYAVIAERAGLSGPSQARKIVERALRKMRKRLSRFRKG
jgi:DNA-directed RNA polymerase specialized sigma subunit